MTDLNALAAGIEADKTCAAIDNIEVQAGVETATPAQQAVALSRDWKTIEEQIAAAQGNTLLELFRDYLCINTKPGNDLAPLYIARIDELLSQPAPAQQAVDVEAVKLFEVIEQECWDVRCISIPTGAGDADVAWEIIEHHMARPKERVVGRGSTPMEALNEAINGGRDAG